MLIIKIKYVLSIALPAIIILLPAVFFSAYCLSINSKHRRKVLIAGLVFLLIGLAVPWIATAISAYGLYKELPDMWIPAMGPGGHYGELYEKTMTERNEYESKAVYFLYAGYLINLFVIPFLGWFFLRAGKRKY